MNSYMRVSSAWIVLCAWDSRTPPLNVKGSRPSRLTFQRRPANARFQEKSRIMCGTANPQRSITVKKVGSAVRAEIVIDGRPAILEKMYINASDRLTGPTVNYLEL